MYQFQNKLHSSLYLAYCKNAYTLALMLTPAGSFKLAITIAYDENLSTEAVPVVSMYSMSDALAVLMLKRTQLQVRFLPLTGNNTRSFIVIRKYY